MIEWIGIFLIIVCILAWYYSHSVSEYRFSQIQEFQIPTQLNVLWEEKIPVIISDITTKDIWSPTFLQITRFWSAQPLWSKYQTDPTIHIPFDKNQQTIWAEILGISQIQEETLLRWFSLPPLVFSVSTETRLGPIPLRPVYGWATSIQCTYGEVRCILLHSAQKARLPSGWDGLRWRDATVAHHPIWTQVKFVEVILRPGTALLVPPHWVVALESVDPSVACWTLWSEIHHPLSKIAKRLHDNNTQHIKL